ncbi:MAG: hypothetical protein ACI9SP_001116 [Arenicella sp.]
MTAILLSKKVKNSPLWRATLTPLASIIGSGFLVVAPLLGNIVGTNAVWAIFAIVIFAYAIGSVLRFNILQVEPLLNAGGNRWLSLAEKTSNIALTLAYVVSVAFYIRLLAAFVLRVVEIQSNLAANLLTTIVLMFIGLVGWHRGLKGLEMLEAFAVTIKLTIIATLLIGLADYDFFNTANRDVLAFEPRSKYDTLRALAGVLLIVQGFETSRYLGSAYSAQVRVKSMRIAQILSAVIYIGFIWLIMPLLPLLHSKAIDETAIIDLVGIVSFVLPTMLIIAAVMSQFSAAVADTLGAGGLVVEETNKRVSQRVSYLILISLAIALVWAINVFEIISLASRAFSFYYFAQALVAMMVPRSNSPTFTYTCRQCLLALLSLGLL